MRRPWPPGALAGAVNSLLGGQRPLRDGGVYRGPRQIAHGDEVGAFGLAHLVDGDDVGVFELGGGAGFAQEAFDGIGVPEQAGAHHLEGDDPVQGCVARLVHRGVGAVAKGLQNLVFAQLLLIFRTHCTNS